MIHSDRTIRMLDTKLCLQSRRSISIVVSLAKPHQRCGVPARRKPCCHRVLPGLQLLRNVVGLVGNVRAKIIPSRRQNLIADPRAVDLKSISTQRSHVKTRRGHRLVDLEAVAKQFHRPGSPRIPQHVRAHRRFRWYVGDGASARLNRRTLVHTNPAPHSAWLSTLCRWQRRRRYHPSFRHRDMRSSGCGRSQTSPCRWPRAFRTT